MEAFLGTVSADGFTYEWPIHSIIDILALVLFLLGAIRMQQARKAVHWVRLTLGFALLLFVAIYDGAMWAGIIEMEYWPGMDASMGYAFEIPEIAWWEPWAYWGTWVLSLCGTGLVALGFFGAAREVVKSSMFGAGGKGKKGAQA